MRAWSTRSHSPILLTTALIPATGFHSCAVTVSHAFYSLKSTSPGVRCLLGAPSEASAQRAAPRGAFARCSVVRGILKAAAGAQPAMRHSSWARRCSSDASSGSGGAGGTALDDSSGQGGSELTREERVAIYWIEECAPNAGVRRAPMIILTY